MDSITSDTDSIDDLFDDDDDFTNISGTFTASAEPRSPDNDPALTEPLPSIINVASSEPRPSDNADQAVFSLDSAFQSTSQDFDLFDNRRLSGDSINGEIDAESSDKRVIEALDKDVRDASTASGESLFSDSDEESEQGDASNAGAKTAESELLPTSTAALLFPHRATASTGAVEAKQKAAVSERKSNKGRLKKVS